MLILNNIGGQSPMKMAIDIAAMVTAAAKQYAVKIMTLTTRSQYNLGMRSESISDARRTYIARLRSLSELANQFNDEDAKSLIAGAIGYILVSPLPSVYLDKHFYRLIIVYMYRKG